MKSKPLGCLSITGVMAALITVALLCYGFVGWGSAMFSPGELSTHTGGSQLGGVYSHSETGRDCGACHAVPFSPTNMAALCLDCHQDLKALLIQPENLHGYLLADQGRIVCRDCHSEHNGPDAALTKFSGKDFPHDIFGYSLNGHNKNLDGRAFECSDCHAGNEFAFSASTCETCHLEIEADFMIAHSAEFGGDCLSCHDGIDRYARPFDHESLGFILGPAHQDLGCVNCHEGARSQADLQQASFACVECHLNDDAHAGAFGSQCAACHPPTSWQEASVNHDLTGFPLLGAHLVTPCQACHTSDRFGNTPTQCSDCHQADDTHAGAFGQQCDTCHTPLSWNQVNFSHEGGQAVSCTACHLNDRPIGHYSGQCSACHSTATWIGAFFNHTAAGATDCISCHTKDRPPSHFPGQCSACHTTDTWLGATFRHSFPLNHGKANRDCAKCHPSGYTSYSCYSCHNKQKMQAEHREEGVGNLNNCVRCHPGGRKGD